MLSAVDDPNDPSNKPHIIIFRKPDDSWRYWDGTSWTKDLEEARLYPTFGKGMVAMYDEIPEELIESRTITVPKHTFIKECLKTSMRLND